MERTKKNKKETAYERGVPGLIRTADTFSGLLGTTSCPVQSLVILPDLGPEGSKSFSVPISVLGSTGKEGFLPFL